MAGRWGIWEWAVLGVVQVFVSVSVTGMQVTSVQGPGLPLTCLAPSAYHRAWYIVGLANLDEFKLGDNASSVIYLKQLFYPLAVGWTCFLGESQIWLKSPILS